MEYLIHCQSISVKPIICLFRVFSSPARFFTTHIELNKVSAFPQVNITVILSLQTLCSSILVFLFKFRISLKLYLKRQHFSVCLFFFIPFCLIMYPFNIFPSASQRWFWGVCEKPWLGNWLPHHNLWRAGCQTHRCGFSQQVWHGRDRAWRAAKRALMVLSWKVGQAHMSFWYEKW